MSSRPWKSALFAAATALAASALSLVACSSSTGDDTSPDDASIPDATADGSGHHDATADTSDAGSVTVPPSPDSGPGIVGKCSPVQGPACDLVLQDCPATDAGVPQECLLAPGGPPYTTQCVPVVVSEHLGKGHGCCVAAADKQCGPGLECIGDPNVPCDAGATGRCSPHCCGSAIDGGDDYLCGQSDPEGYVGHCDTQLVDQNDTVLYSVCSYTRPCEPFGIKPCPTGFTCDFRDTAGSAGCDDIYVPDGGAPPVEGEPCFALNGCADGYACLGSGNPGVCEMMCLVSPSKPPPPFDAGALDGGPLLGGCNAGKTCKAKTNLNVPAWLGFCE
jgi:hypothetical protein